MGMCLNYTVFNASPQVMHQLACVKLSSVTDTIPYVLLGTPNDDIAGVVISPIAPGTRGSISVLGIVSGVSLGAYTTGTLLYVGADGYLTNINNGKQHVAVVLNPGSNGTIYVNTTIIESFSTSGDGVSGPVNPQNNGIAFFTGEGVIDTAPQVQVDPLTQGFILGSGQFSGLLGPIVLLDDQPTSQEVLSYPALNNEDMILKYSLVRDGHRSVGEMVVIDSSSGTYLMQRFGETTPIGIEFQVAKAGPNVVLSYISTNIGFNTSFRYKFVRWGGQ